MRPTGNLIRDLRSVGVNYSQTGKPKGRVTDGVESRIDDEVVLDDHGVEWKVVEYGAGVEDGEIELTLRAKEEDSLKAAEKIIHGALKKADEITHVGFLTFPDRGAFPRIIGNKGGVINDLSIESNAEIVVPRDDTTVKIYG